MTYSISITRLSKQARSILSHLGLIPTGLQETIQRFPFHCARVFAIGAWDVLNPHVSHPCRMEEDPIRYLTSSCYRETLNLDEFAYIIPTRTIELLLHLGSIAGHSLSQGGGLKILKRDPYVINAIMRYINQNDVLLTPKKSSTLDSWQSRLDLAVDSEATGIDGMKECYLVSEYYERIYHRTYPEKDHILENNIYNLDYDQPPFYSIVELKEGDQLLFDRINGMFEANWPDVLLSNKRYSIVDSRRGSTDSIITTQSVMDFDDIRLPVLGSSGDSIIHCFILCKRGNKWGAIFSNSNRTIKNTIFMNVVVPFVYDTPEMSAEEVQKLLERPIETKWVSWNEFKGCNQLEYER